MTETISAGNIGLGTSTDSVGIVTSVANSGVVSYTIDPAWMTGSDPFRLPVPPDKPVRKRKPKIIPPFSNVPTTGEITESEGAEVYNMSERATQYGECPLLISPYSPLIPITYLRFGGRSFNGGRENLITPSSMKQQFASEALYNNEKWVDKIIKKMSLDKSGVGNIILWNANGYRLTNKERIEYAKKDVNDYLSFDKSISATNLFTGRWGTASSIPGLFTGINLHYGRPSFGFRVRSHRGCLSTLTYLSGDMYTFTPMIMAVIEPENYLYQKYHILSKGTIDLSRVIILVNRYVDDPDFGPPARKKMYKGFEAYIKKTNCSVWKVPSNYIMENCFLPTFAIESKTVRGIREEKKGIIEKFYENISKPVATATPGLIMGSRGTLETSAGTYELMTVRNGDGLQVIGNYVVSVDPYREEDEEVHDEPYESGEDEDYEEDEYREPEESPEF